jgi:hypothetical protein
MDAAAGMPPGSTAADILAAVQSLEGSADNPIGTAAALLSCMHDKPAPRSEECFSY